MMMVNHSNDEHYSEQIFDQLITIGDQLSNIKYLFAIMFIIRVDTS